MVGQRECLPKVAPEGRSLLLGRTQAGYVQQRLLDLEPLPARRAVPHIEVSEQQSNPFLRRLSAFTPGLLESAEFSHIGLFCGGGGLDLGLAFAGFRCLVASDIVPQFVETVVHNMPHAAGLVEDAMALTAGALSSAAGTTEIDLVAAGPPCQAFSILGRRGALDDPRGRLALKYFELIADLRPRAFLFENVPGLLTTNGGADWRRLQGFAKDTTGYDLHVGKLNSVTFGIPQVRERVIVVGFREPCCFRMPMIATGPYAKELMQEGHLASPSIWALQQVEGLPNHNIRLHGDRVTARYHAIAPGMRDKTDHTDRIDPNRPSGTVLVGSSAGGGRPHIHPIEPRVITVREAARLQSFPDWYVFRGTGTNQYRQIGNAVPPLLAYELGSRIAAALRG